MSVWCDPSVTLAVLALSLLALDESHPPAEWKTGDLVAGRKTVPFFKKKNVENY